MEQTEHLEQVKQGIQGQVFEQIEATYIVKQVKRSTRLEEKERLELVEMILSWRQRLEKKRIRLFDL